MAEVKKLTGRPKLESGKRSRKVDVRFTEEEYQDLTDLEKELGLSKTEIVRLRVLDKGARGVVNAKELVRLLDAVGAEMGRSGNNINQLARHANTLKLQGNVPPGVAAEFNGLLEQYIAMQQSLESALRTIIRLMGK